MNSQRLIISESAIGLGFTSHIVFHGKVKKEKEKNPTIDQNKIEEDKKLKENKS